VAMLIGMRAYQLVDLQAVQTGRTWPRRFVVDTGTAVQMLHNFNDIKDNDPEVVVCEVYDDDWQTLARFDHGLESISEAIKDGKHPATLTVATLAVAMLHKDLLKHIEGLRYKTP
jgi:hypothetical protein